jgi:peptide/nickel transport system permease protein
MSDVTATAESVKVPVRRGPIMDFMVRLVREKPLGLIGGGITFVLLLVGILADLLAPYGYNDFILSLRLAPPGGEYLLGGDTNGRDLFSRIIYGARISMIVGLAGAGIHVIVGTLIGAVSGFFGGKYDTVVQRFVDAVMCFPSFLLYLTIMAIVGQGMAPLIFVLGISGGFYGSRTIRSAVIGIKENVYLEAAKSIGARSHWILLRHVIPNIMPILIIEFTLTVGRLILAEAMLSFLGFGVPPPAPSWGGMLSGSARQYMQVAPWLMLWPGLALAIAVYGVNMFGDTVRDLLDPRMRGGSANLGGSKAKNKKQKRDEGAPAPPQDPIAAENPPKNK